MASGNEPFDIQLKHWPPETVEKGFRCRENSFVPKSIVSFLNEGVALVWWRNDLVMAGRLFSPENVAAEEKVGRLTHEGTEVLVG
jgi:hypothetical protein